MKQGLFVAFHTVGTVSSLQCGCLVSLLTVRSEHHLIHLSYDASLLKLDFRAPMSYTFCRKSMQAIVDAGVNAKLPPERLGRSWKVIPII